MLAEIKHYRGAFVELAVNAEQLEGMEPGLLDAVNAQLIDLENGHLDFGLGVQHDQPLELILGRAVQDTLRWQQLEETLARTGLSAEELVRG